MPSLSVADAAIAEGNAGTKTLAFTVRLSAASASTVTVAVATADGTAKVANLDYVASVATLSFAPGQTARTFSVVINGDRRRERDETFEVRLSNPTVASISDATGIGRIATDDALRTGGPMQREPAPAAARALKSPHIGPVKGEHRSPRDACAPGT